MWVSGRSYTWPRSFWARWRCETPRPSVNRPPVASWRVSAAIRVVCASWPQMLTIAVPRPMDEVAPASSPTRANGSRPADSGTHRVPYPSCSTRAPNASRSVMASESGSVQTPMRPSPRSPLAMDRCYPVASAPKR